MNHDDLISELEQRTKTIISDDPAVFLVDIRIKPTNNVKVFVDADTGMSIEKLVNYNRRLYRNLDESGLFPNGDFSLELSSPGLDEPLKLHRQYLKNVGRFVEVTRMDGIKTEGKLLGADESGIRVEEVKGKNKKKEVIDHSILFDNIKTTKVQTKF